MKPIYNAHTSHMLILYPGTGFMAQRLLLLPKDLYGLQTALGQNRGLRLGSMGLKRGSSFLWVKRCFEKGSRKGCFSP